MDPTKTQLEAILEHMRAGHTITPLDALAKFHCFRLAARIRELREIGFKIVTREKRLTNGKTIAEYALADEERAECAHVGQ